MGVAGHDPEHVVVADQVEERAPVRVGPPRRLAGEPVESIVLEEQKRRLGSDAAQVFTQPLEPAGAAGAGPFVELNQVESSPVPRVVARGRVEVRDPEAPGHDAADIPEQGRLAALQRALVPIVISQSRVDRVGDFLDVADGRILEHVERRKTPRATPQPFEAQPLDQPSQRVFAAGPAEDIVTGGHDSHRRGDDGAGAAKPGRARESGSARTRRARAGSECTPRRGDRGRSRCRW